MNTEILQFLRGKLAEAEKAVRCREEMAATFQRSTDPKFFEEMSKQPGVVITRSGRRGTTTKDVLESAASQRRIAEKHRHEVKMFKAAIAALENVSK